MTRDASPMPSAEIEMKVAFLRQPDVYPEPTEAVEVIETHMAWVFLTDRHAYKLKKPVQREALDFRTLAARRRDSEAEVRLNRRLAPDVYLGTIPLTLDATGALHLGGDGEVIDWLVHMQRLPADRMLDRMIAERTVPAPLVRRAAKHLARFYAEAAPVPMTPAAYRARLDRDLQACPEVLREAPYHVPAHRMESVAALQRSFLHEHAALFDARVQARRIIEAHGDLRPEHICLTPQPVFFDCLEFSRALRLLDPASELAFLTMECERLGAAWVGDLFFETYRDVTGDAPPPRLVTFYKSYWAVSRSSIAVQHTRRPDDEGTARWGRQATNYVRQAETYVQRLGEG